MNRWRIFSIGRTDVLLHPALLLYVLYSILTGHLDFMLIAMASIILHESAHALVSAVFRQPPNCIELTPLGAVMRLEDETRLSACKRALMLAAGPFMTFLLCCAAIFLVQRNVLPVELGRLLFLSNLSILLLNLLPALPLDGGRMLVLLLGCFSTPRTINRAMRIIGNILGSGMILLNIFASFRHGGWNLSLAFVGCCLLYSAATGTMTQAMAELRWLMDRKIALERKGCCRIKWCAVLHTQPLRAVVRNLPIYGTAMFVCIEAGSMNTLGWLTEAEVVRCYLQTPELRCSDVLKLRKIESPESANSDTI